MTTNQVFYCPDRTYYERSESYIDRALREGRITQDDKKLINSYLLEKDSLGISPTRHWKLVNHLILLREYHPPYLECTTEDVLAAFNSLKYAKRKPRRSETFSEAEAPLLKQNTIGDKQRVLKYMFLWIAENGKNPNLDPGKLRKMRPLKVDYNTVHEGELLTEEELQAFFSACLSARDRAMFNVMFEGALRAGDVGNLQFKDLELNERYCRIKTSQKTGIQRIIPIQSSRVYLSQWLNNYPKQNPSPEDFVFLNNQGNPITHAAITKQISKISTRAGITKKIHPHIFRHTRITMLSRSGLDEAKIKLIAWGNQSTNMMRTYNHLTVSDLEEALAELNGIETPKKRTESFLKPIQCPKCGTINPAGYSYCETCNKPLTQKAEADLEALGKDLLERLTKNPSALIDIFK